MSESRGRGRIAADGVTGLIYKEVGLTAEMWEFVTLYGGSGFGACLRGRVVEMMEGAATPRAIPNTVVKEKWVSKSKVQLHPVARMNSEMRVRLSAKKRTPDQIAWLEDRDYTEREDGFYNGEGALLGGAAQRSIREHLQSIAN